MIHPALRSLRHRDYRLYFFGQLLSMVGTWMQGTALSWLVYRLTGSSLLLGALGFASQIPTLLFGLLGGALADRFDKRKLAIVTQTLSLLQAAILAWLTMTGRVTVPHLFVLGAFLGLINSVDMPVRQSFVVELVEREDIGNAIALNSSMVNLSRIAGPAAAGFLIAAYGEGVCFLINAVSYLAAIVALLLIRREHIHHRLPSLEGVSFRFIKDGVRYVATHRRMRTVLLSLGAMGIVSIPYMVLLPIVAQDVLHAGAPGLGFLTAATGVGAVFGALLLAQRRSTAGLQTWMGWSMLVFGCSLMAFGASRSMPVSLLLLVITGATMMSAFAGSNTLLQDLTADEMRGRVMSLFTMTFMGTMPLGSLLAGWLAQAVGAPLTIAASGIATLAAGAVFLRASEGF